MSVAKTLKFYKALSLSLSLYIYIYIYIYAIYKAVYVTQTIKSIRFKISHKHNIEIIISYWNFQPLIHTFCKKEYKLSEFYCL